MTKENLNKQTPVTPVYYLSLKTQVNNHHFATFYGKTTEKYGAEVDNDQHFVSKHDKDTFELAGAAVKKIKHEYGINNIELKVDILSAETATGQSQWTTTCRNVDDAVTKYNILSSRLSARKTPESSFTKN